MRAKILVVEDERVVAADIEDSLRKLGYSVVGAAASGASAIRQAVESEPDLVLMDIKLRGRMDGIDTASALHERLGVPVVFLTAYADGEILERAKRTSPSGYVLKPFDERALRSAVEIALDRHPKERRLAESERRFVTALRGFDDAVILTGPDARITFLNRAAERLTGWPAGEASGRPTSDVLVLLDGASASLRSDVIRRVLREGQNLSLGSDAILVSRYGSKVRVEGAVSPLREDGWEIVGAAVVFRPGGAEEFVAQAPLARDRVNVLGRLSERLAESLDTAARENRAGTQPDELRRSLERARLLAERVRSLSRPGSGRQAVDLNGWLSELLPALEIVAGEGVGVSLHPGEGAGGVMVDPVRLEQSLVDLVFLAGRRMPFGGHITLETEAVELLPEFAETHTCLGPGRYALISLHHAGAVLIPPAEDVETDCRMARDAIRRAGGDLTLRVEPGRVTTYDIYLPRAPE